MLPRGLLLATLLRPPGNEVEAAGGVSSLLATAPIAASAPGDRTRLDDPVGTVANRYSYHAGTEELGPDEIRVVACGTGMPAARRGQAAACFLVELGNGDKSSSTSAPGRCGTSCPSTSRRIT